MAPARRGGGSRGRGRGRGASRFDHSSRGGRNAAVKGRVADLEFPDDDRSSSEPQPPIEDHFTEEEIDDSVSEEESELEQPGQSYNVLLEGFGHRESRSRPNRKRRKLNGHQDRETNELLEDGSLPRRASYTALLKGFDTSAASGNTPRTQEQTDETNLAEDDNTATNNSKEAFLEGQDIEDSDMEAPTDDHESEQDEDLRDDNEEDLDNETSGDEASGDEDAEDPFEAHFNGRKETELLQATARSEKGEWISTRSSFGTVGQCVSSTIAAKSDATQTKTPNSTGDVPFLKRRLLQSSSKVINHFNDIEQALATPLLHYRDVLFGARSPNNASSLRVVSCLHALNHIHKTRDRLIKNNARLAADTNLEARDQGFTRPKVLFLLETRQNCARYVETLLELSGAEQIENKKRLFDTFSSSDKHPKDMPEDFRELFDGNDDNVFRVGLKLTRKTLKLFSKFYASDVIFASPLGLRLAIEGKGPKHLDYDFLSSIEMVVMDQADAMLMQNWEHVDYVFEHLNLQPKESHGCDYSRVRNWYLDGNARYLRQTVVFSAYLTPTLLNLYGKHMRNIAGKVKHQPVYSGVIAEPLNRLLGIKQTFSRFVATSPSADPEARFQYFTTAVLPSLARIPKPAKGGQGILILIPSHADFSRLQNHFATSSQTMNIAFGAISEFTQPSDVRRARSHFERGRHAVLLYSARAHHFRRYRIKGVKKVVFYGLPDNPVFYQELVGGFLGHSAADGHVSSGEAAVRVLFTKWDLLALERIVGSKRVATMIKECNGADTFDFV